MLTSSGRSVPGPVAVCLLALAAAAFGAIPQQRPGIQPAPAAPTATPAVRSLAATPAEVPEAARLMLTPRAHLLLHPRVDDPRGFVQDSGRMGCSLSLRAIASGIVEFLFPVSGLLHRGDPLFRLYDPAIIPDLAAAERAMQSYEVRPLLIAPPPLRISSVPRGIVPSPAGFFPSPTVSARALPTVRPQVAGPRPAAAPRAAPAPAAAPRAELKPAPRRAAKLQSLPEAPKADLGPYQDAVAEAKGALSDARDRVSACEEDYAAKKELVELGALARNAQDASAEKLTQARADESTAEARLAIARDRLESEQKRAEKAQVEYQVARAGAAQDGQEPEDEPQTVEVIRGDRSSVVGPGVEVIRGGGNSEVTPPPAGRRDSAARRPAQPSARSASGRSAPSGDLSYLRRPPAAASSRGDGGLQYRGGNGLLTARFPGTPKELDRLADQRWTDYQAPADGMVVQRAASNGSLIQPGQELLRVVNTQWAQAFVRVDRQDVERFTPGTVVTVTFDGYPDVAFEGWINSLRPEPGGVTARAELVVFCRSGYYGTDAFATLQWLALATPLDEHVESPDPVAAAEVPQAPSSCDRAAENVSLVPESVFNLGREGGARPKSDRLFEGQLQLVDYQQVDQPGEAANAERKRLASLMKWREGFVDGMTRALFGEGVVLTYPRSGEIRSAVERMATGRVSNVPNRCARTMREALGWGLGDAHVWAQALPSRGYVARQDGLARPGDILVWPFTFPPRGSQHIGIAVQQNGRLMLLSNLNGALGTSDVEPGYVAFYNSREG